MVINGDQWFGETLSKTVRVSSPDGTVSSSLVSQDIPPAMTTGSQRTVSITFTNTGDIPWTEGDMIRLGAVGDYAGDAAGFGPVRVMIPAGVSVAPGNQYTFTFTMTAPSAGTYNVQYRMVRDGTAWFGETAQRQVIVT
jgi:hypothetical protein